MSSATTDIGTLIAGGENFSVEFKGEERKALNDAELVEGGVPRQR
jgi:hypothetical protein